MDQGRQQRVRHGDGRVRLPQNKYQSGKKPAWRRLSLGTNLQYQPVCLRFRHAVLAIGVRVSKRARGGGGH